MATKTTKAEFDSDLLSDTETVITISEEPRHIFVTVKKLRRGYQCKVIESLDEDTDEAKSLGEFTEFTFAGICREAIAASKSSK